jgi:hypothetical protein
MKIFEYESIATVNNDSELREKTARKWSMMYSAPGITTESIHCMGCRTDGAKIAHCGDCEIRKCVQEKGFITCGECNELDTCPIVGFEHQTHPDAKANLISHK